MFRKPVLMAVLVVLGLSSAFPLDFWDDEPPETLAPKLLAQMGHRDLLGQVLLFGYYGGDASPEILRSITSRRLGGVKIFGWNVESIRGLAASVTAMQEAAQTTPLKIPLFMVTDQEGGWVRHINRGTTETSGNMSLGASGVPRDSYLTGYYLGLELRALGINMNFAPTVDIYINPEANVIGPRAFSDDPLQTAVLAEAFFKGHRDAGVIATAKHFPGHGNVDVDSHSAMPVIHSTLGEIWNRDLLPYRHLIREGIPVIMTGHLSFPEITGDGMPATLSPYFLTELLREEMGYRGLVVTDDLIMYGVQDLPYNTPTLTKMAIMAGCDLVLVSRTPELHERICRFLMEEMDRDPAFRARVAESAERVLRFKLAYFKDPRGVPLFPDFEGMGRNVRTAQGDEFFLDQSFRSVSAVYWPRDYTPPAEGERILIAGQYPEFRSQGRLVFPQAEVVAVSSSPGRAEREEIRRRARGFDTVILCLSDPASLRLVQAFEDFPGKVIVLSVLTPIYLAEADWLEYALAIYGRSDDSFLAGFSAIKGLYRPDAPVPLDFFP